MGLPDDKAVVIAGWSAGALAAAFADGFSGRQIASGVRAIESLQSGFRQRSSIPRSRETI
jgi:hypothetical protein